MLFAFIGVLLMIGGPIVFFLLGLFGQKSVMGFLKVWIGYGCIVCPLVGGVLLLLGGAFAG